MGLRTKFNIVLTLVFAAGIAVSAWVSHELLMRNAKDEVLRNAGLMMEAALSIRGYTVSQVKPHLEAQLAETFLPQTVPAYAATETFNSLRKKYPDYSYKEATLNPTNPRNRAVEWEADVVNAFRNQADLKEYSGERMTATGPMLYIARPIQIKDPACLACHSVPSAAPVSMIKLFSRMARAADKISTGDFNVPEFGTKGSDEINALGTAFNRMRRSLQKAMKLIER
jgi:protein-histidine pros-kinase